MPVPQCSSTPGTGDVSAHVEIARGSIGRTSMTVEVFGDGRLAEALSGAEVFQDLPDAIRWDLATEMSQVLVATGETVVRQGESTETMFVVIAGELALTCLDRQGGTRTLLSLIHI